MADEGLRRLERRAGAGDLDAQARLLLERVRLGELPAERLRLLFLLDVELAARALGAERPTARPSARKLAEELEALGSEVMVRVAVALARSIIRRDEPYSHRAIRAAEAWILHPDAERARFAGNAANAITGIRTHLDARLHSSVEAAEAVARLAQSATLPDEVPTKLPARTWLATCFGAAFRAHPGGEEEVRRLLREEIEPWVLGQGDPVFERRQGKSVDEASVEGAPIGFLPG